MAVSYMFQFLDNSALAYTSILGLNESLHLSGSQLSWSNSIYYFGYLIASHPFGLLMVRFPVGKVIALSVLVPFVSADLVPKRSLVPPAAFGARF